MTDQRDTPQSDGKAPTPPGRRDRYTQLAKLYCEAGEAFHDEYEAALREAGRVPVRRTVLTETLVQDAIEELARGVWPSELPVCLNVPDKDWKKWLRQGEEIAASEGGPVTGDEYLLAHLYATVGRSSTAIQVALRRALVNFAAAGNPAWKSAAWLLAKFAPHRYNDAVEAKTEENLAKVFKALRDSPDITADDYERIVKAVEAARSG